MPLGAMPFPKPLSASVYGMPDFYAQFFTISVKRLPSAIRAYRMFWVGVTTSGCLLGAEGFQPTLRLIARKPQEKASSADVRSRAPCLPWFHRGRPGRPAGRGSCPPRRRRLLPLPRHARRARGLDRAPAPCRGPPAALLRGLRGRPLGPCARLHGPAHEHGHRRRGLGAQSIWAPRGKK